jgi:hypothetical protein
MLRIRFILVVTITTGGRGPVGTAPPARPVPEPRGTNGRPWARLTRTAAATSSVVVGKQMTAASPDSIEASRRYNANSVGSARTRSGASAAPRSATKSPTPASTADPTDPTADPTPPTDPTDPAADPTDPAADPFGPAVDPFGPAVNPIPDSDVTRPAVVATRSVCLDRMTHGRTEVKAHLRGWDS